MRVRERQRDRKREREIEQVQCLVFIILGIIVSSGTTQLRPKDIELRLKSSGANCIITDSSSVQNVEKVHVYNK